MKDEDKKRVQATAQVLQDLGKVWTPHTGRKVSKDHPLAKEPVNKEFYPAEGQKTVGKAILSGKYRLVFVQFARQVGKTELANGIMWYKSILTPRSSLYYFAPKQKQAKELIWARNRIQTMNAATAFDLNKINDFNDYGKKYIKKINNTEMRVTFVNDSFIKVDGSDNYDEYRGITPDLIIFDEFRDFRPGAYDAFKAATTTKKATIVIISTPPETEGFYTDLMKEAKDPAFKESIFFQMPTFSNPYQDLDEIYNIKRSYEMKGELDVWQREYLGEFVVGGSRSIFPMLTGKELRAHASILEEMKPLSTSLEYYCISDPGSASGGSAFAVLFVAYHRYTKQIFLLDEIYATNEARKSVGAIEPQIREKIRDLTPHLMRSDWVFIYDEAASWYKLEMQDLGYSMLPTCKRSVGKDAGISALKDVFLRRSAHFSNRCVNLLHELTNYVKDDKGKITKVDDHLIDAFRYFLMGADWHWTTEDPENAYRKGPVGNKWVKLEDEFKVWGSNILEEENEDWMDF